MQLSLFGFDALEEIDLRKAVTMFASILFPRKLRNEIYLQIQFDPDLQEQGECWPEDDLYRKFVISVRAHFDDYYRGYDDDPISTIAHEMTHCLQWATGDLTCPMKAYKDPITGEQRVDASYRWKGKPWKGRKHDIEALDAPWEVDAYGNEIRLYKRWQMFKNGLILIK